MSNETNITQAIVGQTANDLKFAVLIVSICVNVSIFVAWVAAQIV